MPPLPGFIGPSYTAASLNAACEMTMNLFPELIESGKGKNQFALYRCPGYRRFATVDGQTGVRQLYPLSNLLPGEDQLFGVIGSKFCQISLAGVATVIGDVGNDTFLTYIISNTSRTQLAIASAGRIYVYHTPTGVLEGPLAGIFGNGLQFLDGYAVTNTGREIFISALDDFTSWDPLDFTAPNTDDDNLVGIIADHGLLVAFGDRSVHFYSDEGAADFPFVLIPGGFLETGTGAPQSIAKQAGSIYLIGCDSNGCGVVYRLQGFSKPERVSDHGIEAAMRAYPTIADACGFCYQDRGHRFYVLTFQTANATWVFDENTAQWHQRGAWNLTHGRFDADRASVHAYAFGKHLIGGFPDGSVYEMSLDIHGDCGAPQRWLRRAPQIFNERKRIGMSRFELDIQTGVGLDGSVQGSDPIVMFRQSMTFGETWQNERRMNIGKLGQYSKRAYLNRLGMARNRVIEVSGSDPNFIGLVNAYADMEAEGH